MLPCMTPWSLVINGARCAAAYFLRGLGCGGRRDRRCRSFDKSLSVRRSLHTKKLDHSMTQQQQEKQQQPDDEFHGAVASAAAAAHPHWQRSFTTWLTPGSALLFSSLPLGLGAYIGYRRTLHESLSPPSSKSPTSSNGGFYGGRGSSILGQMIHPEPPISCTQNVIRSVPPSITAVVSATPPPILAARALLIGSLISISGTSLLISSIFLASGCRSLDELMGLWKSWAPKKLRAFEDSLENYVGIQVGKERRTTKFEYEQAIKGMTEEEELEYVRNKYGGDWQWEDEGNESTK